MTIQSVRAIRAILSEGFYDETTEAENQYYFINGKYRTHCIGDHHGHCNEKGGGHPKGIHKDEEGIL